MSLNESLYEHKILWLGRIMFFQAVWFGQTGSKRLPFANHSPIVVTNCQRTAFLEP